MKRLAIATLATLLSGGLAMAQSTAPPSTSGAGGGASTQEPTNAPGTTKSPSPVAPSMTPRDGSGTGDTGASSGTAAGTAGAALESGANSFTESQARSRLMEAGYANVTGLTKDDQGIWRGKAERNGRSVSVGLDYKGNVSAQ